MALLGADAASELIIEGGTHNEKARPFDHNRFGDPRPKYAVDRAERLYRPIPEKTIVVSGQQ